jgi:hypothetical protein
VFLRVLRIVFIVVGLALLGVGASLVADTKATGGQVVAQWSCEPDGSSKTRVLCTTRQGSYTGPGSLGDVLSWFTVCLSGIGLILAAIALGQFERPRDFAAAQQPGRPPGPSGPPHPGPHPGQQPGPHPGQQQGWPGQPAGPPQHY